MRKTKEIYIPEWPNGNSNKNSGRLIHSDYSRSRGIMRRLQNYINSQEASNKKRNLEG